MRDATIRRAWLPALWLAVAATACRMPPADSGAVKAGTAFHFEISTDDPANRRVPFAVRMPAGRRPPTGVLVLVPGCNGDGGAMLENAAWRARADRTGLALLAPTFRVRLDRSRKDAAADDARLAAESAVAPGSGCYYYPAAWSGKALLDALAELNRRTGVPVQRVLLFGISAGAHFTHRFALWQPERVKAFAVVAAGWWDDPGAAAARLRGGAALPPGLVMCGEADGRHDATLAFFQSGLAAGAPWLWRSYHRTGHELSPAMVRMASAFLEFYAADRALAPVAGDWQRYRLAPPADRQSIPEMMRIMLPDATVAEVWQRE